jgi:meckelin
VKFLVKALVYLVDSVANFFFFTCFILCSYFYLFFKGQSNVNTLMPDSGTEKNLWTLLLVSGIGKFINLLDILWSQTHNTIFFVDWEKSKYYIDDKDYLNCHRGKLMGRGNEKGGSAPVSVWRTLFLVNQWNQMQVFLRKILN